MERIPILKMGDFLLVSIQVDMHDRLALTLQDDLTERIVQYPGCGTRITVSLRSSAHCPSSPSPGASEDGGGVSQQKLPASSSFFRGPGGRT